MSADDATEHLARRLSAAGLSAAADTRAPRDRGRKNPRPLRVLLADRYGPARRVIAAMLADLPGVRLVGQVATHGELGAALDAWRPDVLIIDDRLLPADEHAPECWSALPDDARVIVIGVDEDPGFAQRALRVGAETWIAKHTADDQLRAHLTARPRPTRDPADRVRG